MDTVSGNCSYASTLPFGASEYFFIAALSLSIVYLIPSLFVAYRLASIIGKKRKLSSIFYRIFLHDRIISLTYFVYDTIVNRFPMTGLATLALCKLQPGFGLTVAYVIYHYFAYVCLYSSTLVSVLRLIAVIEPLDADKHQLRLCRILLPTIYLLPLLTTWFLMPAQVYFAPLSASACIALDYKKVFPTKGTEQNFGRITSSVKLPKLKVKDGIRSWHYIQLREDYFPVLQWRSSKCMVFVTSIVCFIDLFCFTVTIIKWRILQKKNKLSQNKSEKSLLFLACSICISHCANCTAQVFFYYSVHYVLSFLVRDFVYDVLTFVPTWVLYMTHPAFGKTAYNINAPILIMNSIKS